MHKVSYSKNNDAPAGRGRIAPESAPAEAKFTVASLFAGIGGFCYAFKKEGFEVVWANENDEWAAETYRENLKSTALYHKPIEDLSVTRDQLSHVDVLTAGFPCQPFSVAGEKLGFRDKRGQLFFEIIRLLREFGTDKPKILLLENVPYLRAHDRGKTFSRIVQEVQSAGYWFMPPRNIATLNTCSHTDIPQNRERLYMVAMSCDHFNTNKFQFPEPEANTRPYREFLDLGQRAEDWFYFSPDSKFGKLFADSMATGNPESIYLLRRHYVRENKSNLVFTLTAHMGEGGHNMPVIKDDWGIRKLTPRECMRLQGFDESKFKFPESVSRTQQYKQIGNAVTVPLVQKLASECRRQLRSLRGSIR